MTTKSSFLFRQIVSDCEMCWFYRAFSKIYYAFFKWPSNKKKNKNMMAFKRSLDERREGRGVRKEGEHFIGASFCSLLLWSDTLSSLVSSQFFLLQVIYPLFPFSRPLHTLVSKTILSTICIICCVIYSPGKWHFHFENIPTKLEYQGRYPSNIKI